MNAQRPPPGFYPAPLTDGTRITFPNPVPVSVRPSPDPPGDTNTGDMGPAYGIQQSAVWQPGDVIERQLLDTRRAPALWRISVLGNLSVRFSYGTKKTRQIVALAPVVITIPGQCIVTATPLDDEGTIGIVTLTQATAGALSQARSVITAGGGGTPFDLAAVRFVALTASTVTISGIGPLAVPVLGSVPLVAGAVLNTGSGFQEFEA